MNNSILAKRRVVWGLCLLVLIGLVAVSVWSGRSHATATATAVVKTPKVTATQKSTKPKPTPTVDPKASFRNILSDTEEQIKTQNEVDQSLLSELYSGSYSFEKPLVVVDPYNQSPLTALVLFTSKEPLQISVHVPGEDALTDVDFTFDKYETDHIIPVYGLYSQQKNAVTLTALTQAGQKSQNTLEIETGPMPAELAGMTRLVDLVKPDQYQPGFNFTSINNYRFSKTAFDAHGKIRWYLLSRYRYEAIYNGHFIFAKGETLKGSALFVETNPLGRIYRIYYAPYGVHHDIVNFNDHLLITGSNVGTNQDFIYELDPLTGKIVNTLDLRTVFQRSRDSGYKSVEDADWFHNNAIMQVPGSNDIVLSGRNQSIVARISWPDGKIKWILGNHTNWLPMFQKYLLSPIGANFTWQFDQHAPEILPDQDNNPDTMDILLFDNGRQRYEFDAELQRKIAAHEVVAPDLYSRMVQYRVDEKAMTVSQVWEFGQEYGKTLFAPIRGDANLLANGNRLGVFDVQSDYTFEDHDLNNSANFIEVNPQGEIVWEVLGFTNLKDGHLIEYRLNRDLLYRSSDLDLQLGSPIQNFIPEEVYKEYNVKP